MLGCKLPQALQSSLPNTTPGCRDRPNKGGIIVIVSDQAQISKNVADFRLVEKTLPARDRVGYAQITQGLLQDARLLIAAVQHRKVAPLGTTLKACRRQPDGKIGRAACRAQVCQYV